MLELRDLSQRYGQVVALDGVSFTVAPGRICGFLGPNGAGKTTAMRAVMGILRPASGEVRWQGRAVDDQVRRRFGYMPEERGLYKAMRVREQLVFLARLHGQQRSQAERSADRWIDALGLAERRGSAVEELSLGNQQRVQLAAALAHGPELLVLDEPFSGLDPIGVDVMSGVLREQAASGAAVVFSSHQLDLVEHLCHEVVVVHRGRVVLSGVVDELKHRGRRRLAVGVEGDPTEELERLDGVSVVRRRGDGAVVVEVDDHVDGQEVLDAARAVGAVTHFSRELPLLSELFRTAVGA